MKLLSHEDMILKRAERGSKKKKRELHKLQWDGNPRASNVDKETLSRDCISQVKKKKK